MLGLISRLWPLVAFIGLSCWYVLLCPYNKVEESFNTQAIHDLIYYWPNLKHVLFFGVVPRTFIGACLVAFLTKTIQMLNFLLGKQELSKLQTLITARCILGILNGLCWFRLQRAISLKFGSISANIFAILSLTQFHPIFYSSRTLPNTFALCLVYLAYSSWLRGREKGAVGWLTICSVIFRFEISIILISLFLTESILNKAKSFGMVKAIILTGSISLLATVLVDSYFWNSWIWPEAKVFYFNVVMNKSSEWGTLPWTWYLQKGLPNTLLLAYPFAFLGLFRSHVEKRYFIPTLVFLGVFSCLPHKELRFVFYTIPILNLMAASSIQNLAIESGKRNTILKFGLQTGLSCIVMLCLASSIFRVKISARNYPGGDAMSQVHDLVQNSSVYLHIDVYTAMNGCSRFSQASKTWKYYKTENLQEEDYLVYSHLLSTVPIEGFEKLASIKGFSGLRFNVPRKMSDILTMFPFVTVCEEDKILVLQRSLPGATSEQQMGSTEKLDFTEENSIGRHEEL